MPPLIIFMPCITSYIFSKTSTCVISFDLHELLVVDAKNGPDFPALYVPFTKSYFHQEVEYISPGSVLTSRTCEIVLVIEAPKTLQHLLFLLDPYDCLWINVSQSTGG